MSSDRAYMLKAIEKAREGISKRQTPFGACIVKDFEILAVEHNNVWARSDITAHAEICAIQAACRKEGTIDLSGSVIYSTTEPCPMCFSAIHWARISGIYFGTSIEDADEAGFNELPVSNSHLKEEGRSNIKIIGGFCREEALELFAEWKKLNISKSY